jgi:hypothetical protein
VGNADSHSLFTKFPALIMFVISYHTLVLSAEVIDEENFAFKTAFLSFIFDSFIDIFNLWPSGYDCFMRVNIQSRVCLKITIMTVENKKNV